MRTGKVLLTLVPAAAAAIVAASAFAAAAPPGANYPWAQPNAALPAAIDTQPPAWVAILPGASAP